jgi:DNA-directed RNA polymerase specialized sigma24 family protein
VSRWIAELRAGDPAAIEQICQRYGETLLQQARNRAQRLRRRYPVVDEEWAAQSALRSFFEGAAEGRFPDLENREQLRKLLATMTIHKLLHQVEREEALKRGGRIVMGESVVGPDDQLPRGCGLDQFADGNENAESLIIAAELLARLRKSLPNSLRRAVLDLRVEGYNREEIAERLGCAVKTVSRQLDLIRKAWLGQDELLRRVFSLVAQGASVDEIARETGCTHRTIRSRLVLICERWLSEETP